MGTIGPSLNDRAAPGSTSKKVLIETPGHPFASLYRYAAILTCVLEKVFIQFSANTFLTL
jgi:hypothetical protein